MAGRKEIESFLYYFDGQWFESNPLGQLMPTTKRPRKEVIEDTNTQPLMDDTDSPRCNC